MPIPFEWREKVDEWVAKMGYHFVIDEAETQIRVSRGEKLSLRICIDNVGVAPIYKRLPLYLRLKNAQYAKTFLTDVDIRTWVEGKYQENITVELPKNIPKGEFELQIAIGGQREPNVAFATNATRDEEYFVLATVEIV